MPSSNTTALFILCKGNLILAPSKSEHRLVSQVDPPCTSATFGCEGDRVKYIMNDMISPNLSGDKFNKHFKLVKQPIKFSHRDGLGEKLFTGYIAIVKNEETLKKVFFIDESETMEGIDEIVNGTTHVVISPMFKKAILVIKENAQLYQL